MHGLSIVYSSTANDNLRVLVASQQGDQINAHQWWELEKQHLALDPQFNGSSGTAYRVVSYIRYSEAEQEALVSCERTCGPVTKQRRY